MPCRDDGLIEAAAARHAEEQKERLDLVTRLLCELCTSLDDVVDRDVRDALVSPELDQWLTRHKAEDAERRRKEEEARLEAERQEQERQEQLRIQTIRDGALQKLTEEERRVLGV